MILYYAMGGGLGHLSRSLAILQELPQSLGEQVRLLASSRHAGLAIPSIPCPVDVVAGEILTSRRTYLRFFENYLETYRIGAVILDTFPFGIVGEWLQIDSSIPRMLIARSLKWGAYQERIRHHDGPFPQHALVLETLSEQYFHRLKQESRIAQLDAPITLQTKEAAQASQFEEQGLLIVHSGDESERETLREIARQQMNGKNGLSAPLDCIFPEHGIYPAERAMARYKTIVAAAGYNMVAIASQAPPDQNYILHPFPRRFDDQFLRLQRFRQGQWSCRQDGNGREQAARWLADVLKQKRSHKEEYC